MSSNFTPLTGTAQTIGATSTSSSVTLSAIGTDATEILLVNRGPNTAKFRFGIGAQTAVFATDCPIPSGASFVIGKGNANTVAAITTGAETASLDVQPGYGQ